MSSVGEEADEEEEGTDAGQLVLNCQTPVMFWTILLLSAQSAIGYVLQIGALQPVV